MISKAHSLYDKLYQVHAISITSILKKMIPKIICTPNPGKFVKRTAYTLALTRGQKRPGSWGYIEVFRGLDGSNVLVVFWGRGDRLKTLLLSIISYWHIITINTLNNPYVFTLINKRILNLRKIIIWIIFYFSELICPLINSTNKKRQYWLN